MELMRGARSSSLIERKAPEPRDLLNAREDSPHLPVAVSASSRPAVDFHDPNYMEID
jgi:hypothetical protein